MIKNYEKAVNFNHPSIRKMAEDVLQYVRTQYPAQFEGVLEKGVNFSDIEERIGNMKFSLKKLEELKASQNKRTEQIKTEIQELLKGKRTEEKAEARENLKKEIKKINLPVYGRFGKDSLAHVIMSMKMKMANLLEKKDEKQGKVVNAGQNKERLVNAFEDRMEAVEIAKVIASSLFMILPKKGNVLSPEEAEKVVSVMTDQFDAKMDLKFFPFDHLDKSRSDEEGRPVYDLNEVMPREIRRLLYTTLQGRVMKFGKSALNDVMKENI